MFSTALAQYRHDVATRAFPSDTESYHLPRELQSAFARDHRLARKA
jgi:3-methyl-2-oxobutanoate hydroxymethyltransferase